MGLNYAHSTTLPTVAVVDLERVNYQVTEGIAVQVCALVRTPNTTCPVTFSFEVNLSVGEGIVDPNEQAWIFTFWLWFNGSRYLSIVHEDILHTL